MKKKSKTIEIKKLSYIVWEKDNKYYCQYFSNKTEHEIKKLRIRNDYQAILTTEGDCYLRPEQLKEINM